MNFTRNITTLNPLNLILKQHKLTDITLEYEIVNVIDNDYLPGFQDHFLTTHLPFPGLIASIITTDLDSNIESIIHQYRREYFPQILNLLEELEGNIEITRPDIKDGQYIVFDRGTMMTVLWLLRGDSKLSVQHATKDFMLKLAN